VRPISSPTVLVVEDDNGMRDVLARGLRRDGFEVITAADAHSALAVTADPDAIVLDIGLPDADGRDLCLALRANGLDAPVIFVTARGNSVDRLSGFAAGGDDYLTKPFELAELVARLRAILRRGPSAGARTAGAERTLRIDPRTHQLVCGAASVRLPPTEYRLLAHLLAASGGVVRRAELRAVGWPAGAVVSDNTLDQYMAKLRRRLSQVEAPATIEVVRGVGYVLQ
jgi:two-component system response regulator MprA